MLEDIFNLNNIIGVFINSFAQIYIWSKLLNHKLNFKSAKYYIVHILFAITMMLNYLLINDIIRIIFLVSFMAAYCSILFDRDAKSSILTSFFSQIIMMLSEILFALIITGIFKVDANTLVSSYFLKLWANIAISVIAVFIANLKFTKKIYNFLLKTISNLREHSIIAILVLILISINFIFFSVYYNVSVSIAFAANVIISIIYLIISFKFLITENKYNKINSKYNTTLNSLKEYEEILDAYRVSSHENKNQLLTIRSMVVKKEKNIPDYIDKLIDNKIKDDEKLMFDANTIPAGGLRATIYSKMLFMKENNINFNLKVDRNVRTVELIELGDDLMLDVCKIIGVFLDNAIEAVKDIDEKMVDIILFSDKQFLQIEIINNFEGIIDVDKLDDKGYTSKSKGHGYGLCLVRDIIKRNNSLINERKINKNIFTQVLKIKLK